MIEKKNTLYQINASLDIAEENISKTGDITIKTIQHVIEKKKLKKSTEDQWSLNFRTTFCSLMYMILAPLQGRKRKGERRNTGKIMAKKI